MNKAARFSQWHPLSCTECARRKIRCSKTIPCISYMDRGQGATGSRGSKSTRISETSLMGPRPSRSNAGLRLTQDVFDNNAPATNTIAAFSDSTYTSQNTALLSPPTHQHRSLAPKDSSIQLSSPQQVKSIQPVGFTGEQTHNLAPFPDEAQITLEFPALGRQRVLNMEDSPQSPNTPAAMGHTYEGDNVAKVSFLSAIFLVLETGYAVSALVPRALNLILPEDKAYSEAPTL